MHTRELLQSLRGGGFDAALRTAYGNSLPEAYARIESVVRGFGERFGPAEEREVRVYSAPGRTELGGNHTDHQNGCALAASISPDTLACAAENGENLIRVHSKGHAPVEIDFTDTAVHPEEKSSSRALVRGVASRIAAMGYPVRGFDAYTETLVLRGSGMSSSAAFEVLLGTILNDLCCGGALTSTQIAQIGQYAENVYYGKPCGLMDQMACATGGAIAIDFSSGETPEVRRCAVDFRAAGYALVIVDSGANHSDLDDEYAAITREMGAVARFFGREKLREVDEDDFIRARSAVEAACGQRAALRAEHFFAETRRAQQQYEALSRGDLPAYLALMRESGLSSERKLQNVALPRPGGDRLLRVIERARELAGPEGAARVHGGGFAGTAQALVPLSRLDAFLAGMEDFAGKGCCHAVRIRAVGGVRLI